MHRALFPGNREDTVAAVGEPQQVNRYPREVPLRILERNWRVACGNRPVVPERAGGGVMHLERPASEHEQPRPRQLDTGDAPRAEAECARTPALLVEDHEDAIGAQDDDPAGVDRDEGQ